MTESKSLSTLRLAVLMEGCPALTPAAGQALAESASVCLEEQGHDLETPLAAEGSFTKDFVVIRFQATEQMRRCYNDAEEATEQGACGIAILAIRNLTGFTVIERSRKGTGFDYWLGTENELPLQAKARLEVSGIRSGDESIIQTRVRQKVQQTYRSDDAYPAYIVVVEFSRPTAWVVQR